MTQNATTALRRYSAKTDVGCVRDINEDALVAVPELGLWAVADGMGGHVGGDFASKTVVDALEALPHDLTPVDIMHAARDTLQTSHAAIRQEAARKGNVTIGATAVLLVLSEAHFMCLWAGDSRLYRLRDRKLVMVSHDHSIVGDMVEAGQMTWAEAEHHPHSNQITRAIGVGDVLEIDKRRGDVMPGDRFLLCSDGLTKYADDTMLQDMLCMSPIETAAEHLMQIALDGGGRDNVSVIVIEV
ncbi:serine/threonine-protein phosphatase [Loktanella sp. D2R18]|uniref:PP2C family protein-serine/threonine phosphatase n=1 Tax=Rhodobacterales TaxID=204455 RepID=UPI000DEBB000|nr:MULTISPECIES: protein phosphatase 2C domain-containing protein [Rhodobacterales]MDO6590559.1 protein phosphatase 2C domain-containing protein [Yoonia sp. 1_MG-2023]RBW41275.1 serine/threonine-protein phosphatase [Loktanella sp. D2R18]